jgi:hypothetical protein
VEKKEDPKSALHLRKQRRLKGADVLMVPIAECLAKPGIKSGI